MPFLTAPEIFLPYSSVFSVYFVCKIELNLMLILLITLVKVPRVELRWLDKRPKVFFISGEAEKCALESRAATRVIW